MNGSTMLVLGIIIVIAILAIIRIRKKGGCSGCASKKHGSSCSGACGKKSKHK